MRHTKTWIFVLFSLSVACAGDDGGDDGLDTAMDAGSGSGPGTSGNDSGPSDGSSSGNPDTGNDSGSDSGNDSGNDTTGEDACFGDFMLGYSSFQGDGVFVPCDSVPATNCADGYFIVFNDTNECICIPECASLGLSVGDPCNESGSIVCTAIENDSGESSGNLCVDPEWNLCGPG